MKLFPTLFFLAAIGWTAVVVSARSQESVRPPGAPGTARFTGDVLTVFYVRDLAASVEHYTKKLGFRLNHFHDYETGESVPTWTKTEPPIYAEMAAGDFRFALHRSSDPEKLVVGGSRHYFGVEDADAHRGRLVARGVDAGEMIDRPWMRMFRVEDADGHVLYFFTRPDED